MESILVTLITALFYDLSPDKVEKVPSNSERRERLLLELIQKARLPVALFVMETILAIGLDELEPNFSRSKNHFQISDRQLETINFNKL